MKKVRGVCVTDCKAIPREACLTQHRLVCAAFRFSESKKKKWKGMRKIKIWKLKQFLKQFCYLGDVLECGGRSERVIRATVGAGWGKWKEIASLLVNRGIPLHHRGKVYEACIRSVMLYGG